MITRLTILLALSTVACTKRAPEQDAHIQQGVEAKTNPSPEQRPEAPAVVRWQQKSVDGGRLVLTAQVELRTRMPAPVQVRLEIPAGAKLVQGEPSFTIAPSEQPQLVEREYVFEVSGQPAEDLVLIADASTKAFGFHATDAYRFGRSETVIRPNASGQDIRIGNKNLGGSVPMNAPTK